MNPSFIASIQFENVFHKSVDLSVNGLPTIEDLSSSASSSPSDFKVATSPNTSTQTTSLGALLSR
ncbi:hypothetical protein D3C76_1823290 [compost metagenome]